jgi:hypothetical protein
VDKSGTEKDARQMKNKSVQIDRIPHELVRQVPVTPVDEFFEPEKTEQEFQLPAMQSETMAEIASKLAQSNDLARIAVATSLINTWNYAVQEQGKRLMWNESDTRSFLIALASIDSIGARSMADEVEKQLRCNQG